MVETNSLSSTDSIGKLSDTVNVAKVIATLLVVMGHVANMYAVKSAVKPAVASPELVLLREVIYSFHMPAFFAVSGAVYYFVKCVYSRYGCNVKFVKNKALRLLLPCFFFALFVVFPTMCYIGRTEGNMFDYVFRSYFMMLDLRHLWFLPALFICMVVMNLLHDFISKHKAVALFMFLAINVCYRVIPTKLTMYFQINSAMHYALYFYVGYLIAHFVLTGRLRLSGKMFGISVALWVVSMLVKSLPVCDMAIIGVFVEMVCALSGTMMLFSLAALLQQKTGFRHSPFFESILKNSYGIYLFHAMIIYLCFFQARTLQVNPYVFSVSVFCVSLALSVALSEMMRRIPYLKIVVGEKTH